MKNKLFFMITENSILASPDSRQPMLRVLKELGAPIKGTLFLEVDPAWKVTSWENLLTKSVNFQFDRKKEVDECGAV